MSYYDPWGRGPAGPGGNYARDVAKAIDDMPSRRSAFILDSKNAVDDFHPFNSFSKVSILNSSGKSKGVSKALDDDDGLILPSEAIFEPMAEPLVPPSLPLVPPPILIDNDIFFFRFNDIVDNINDVFGNFNFSQLFGDIVGIGRDEHGKPKSSNAFNFILNFNSVNPDVNRSELSTVLKNSKGRHVDNNYYEFLVGICLNNVKQFFPNFIFTFNYYEFPEDIFDILRNIKHKTSSYYLIDNSMDCIAKATYDNVTEIADGLVNSSCKRGSSILIEGITDSITLKHFIDIEYSSPELINILFQIYFALNSLDDLFIHYDLHRENILLKRVPNGKFIEIEYTLFSGVKKIIKTKYIPVIIDYGRSFIDCDAFSKNFITSKNFADKACSNSCNTRSGKKNEPVFCATGSTMFVRDFSGEPKVYDYSEIRDGFGYLNSEIKNKSQDNRLLVNVFGKLNGKDDYLFSLVNDDTIRWPIYDTNSFVYGVSEKLDEGFIETPKRIYNIYDAMLFLLDQYDRYNLEDYTPINAFTRRPLSKYGQIKIEVGKKWLFIPN